MIGVESAGRVVQDEEKVRREGLSRAGFCWGTL